MPVFYGLTEYTTTSRLAFEQSKRKDLKKADKIKEDMARFMLKQLVGDVEDSKIFCSFIKKHPGYYLAHCFTMLNEGDKEKDIKWELGYYSDNTDKLVVFETVPEIKMHPEEEAFKKEGSIKKLDIKKVKVSITKTMKICNELVEEKYPNRSITKSIIILQNLEKQIYNITFVTLSFDILNIRLDAATGEVLSDNIQSIMSLGKVEK